jgi:hypothetical protein
MLKLNIDELMDLKEICHDFSSSIRGNDFSFLKNSFQVSSDFHFVQTCQVSSTLAPPNFCTPP